MQLKRRRRVTALPQLALVAVACLLALLPSTASASHVSCGQVITRDTTLDSDLSCDPNVFESYLVIGADNVTLDLGGHKIGGGVLERTAVDNRAGHDGVTVRNGVIDDFGTGVAVRGASGNQLSNLRVFAQVPLELEASTANRIENSSLLGLNRAVVLAGSNRNEVVGNSIDTIDGTGVVLADSNENRIERNELGTNPFGGISVRGSRNGVSRNRVADTSVEPGIGVGGGADNRIEENSVSRSGSGGSEDGIFVAAAATGTYISRNLAFENTDDGIDVESPGTILEANTANDNADLGIEAVPGVIDAGGNRASGNGNPLQCLNVVCNAVGDTTPPALTVPGPVSANATGPGGATVSYSATATDDADPRPVVHCIPPSGSTFAIGRTTVTCTATDRAGNRTTRSFVVVVRGAGEQIGGLSALVRSLGLHRGAERSLTSKLEAADAALRTGRRDEACGSLKAFLNHVRAQSGKKLTQAQADRLSAAATRVRTVLDC